MTKRKPRAKPDTESDLSGLNYEDYVFLRKMHAAQLSLNERVALLAWFDDRLELWREQQRAWHEQRERLRRPRARRKRKAR